MAATAKRLFTPAQLGGAVATYYNAPDGTHTIIKKLTFTNSTGGSVDVTVYLVPGTGSADATNILIDALPIAAHTCYEATVAEGHVLNPEDTIQAFASAGASIDILGSGVELT